MKHLFSFIVICIIRLAAGLPRLYDVNDDSSSITQQSNWESHALKRSSEEPDEELIPRANLKDGSYKETAAASMQKTSPSIQSASKQGPRTVPTTSDRQTDPNTPIPKQSKIANSKVKTAPPDLTPQEHSVKQTAKTEIQALSKQKPVNNIQSASNQKTKSGSKQQSAENQVLPSKNQNKVDSAPKKQSIERQLPSKQPSQTQTLDKPGSNKKPPNQKPSGIAEAEKGRKSLQGISRAVLTTKNARISSTRGKDLPSNTKGLSNVKNTQQNNKRAGSDFGKKTNKPSTQKKRLCRRTNNRQSCKWDVEEGGGRSMQDQPDTSKPDTAPSMISQMSRAGKDYARAHPLRSATFGLGASSAFFGNAAGVTDQCCHEPCASTAAHVLNYCGMTAGVAGVGMAFAGAVIAHQQRQKEKEQNTREIETLKMTTEGHTAAIEDQGKKIDQTTQRFSGELARTKQTLHQMSKRVGGPRVLDDLL